LRVEPDLTVLLDWRSTREDEEGAFLYFLEGERSRADRSNRALRLLLVTVEPVPGRAVGMERATAARLLAELKHSLRETDVTGWYRQNRMAGAVLSERADAAGDPSRDIRHRVDRELRQRLPSAVACNLRVRLIQLARPSGH
jgi:hypothetical protein